MRADRLLSLLVLLQAHGRLTATDLAGRLEVSVRTVFRDMDALSTAGFPVYAERGRTGGCALLPGFRTDVTGLTAAEAQALFVLTGGGATPVADLGLGAEARSALRKLAAGLPASVRPEAGQLARHIVVDPHGWNRPNAPRPEPDRWLTLLRQAVHEQKRVRMRYESQHEGPGERLVDPWGLVVKAGVWYLIAAHRGRPRMYRVSRVARATVLPQPARRPPDLDLEAVWRDLRDALERPPIPTVEVRLRVRPDIEPLFLRMVTAQLADAPPPRTEGDELILTFRALPAARNAVLGFGDAVEVLEPAELRAEIREFAAAVVRLYEPTSSAS